MKDRFPVLWHPPRRDDVGLHELGCPKYVPWSIVSAHETQAVRNHQQSLDALARRGGLGPKELVAVLTDRCWTEVTHLTDGEIVAQLLALLEKDS